MKNLYVHLIKYIENLQFIHKFIIVFNYPKVVKGGGAGLKGRKMKNNSKQCMKVNWL
jgi:hypothetical protein